jgi:hypothetical protein
MNLNALVVVPFVAWHAYRVIHAFRTGVFHSLGSVLDRATEPDLFWFRVARESLLATLFGALFLSLLLGLSRGTSVWLFGTYVAVYATIIFATIMRRRRRVDHGA